MAPRSRAGIINNGTLTWNRTHNPRRHPCPHCTAPPGAPCRNGPRELTWYHQPRQDLAANEPEQHDPPDLRPPELPTPPPNAQLPTPRRAGPTRHQRAEDWLRRWLEANDYSAPAHDTLTAARNAGISRTTLHRARTRLGITTHQPPGQPHPGWHWNLTPPTPEPDLPPLAKASLTEAGQLALTINNRAAPSPDITDTTQPPPKGHPMLNHRHPPSTTCGICDGNGSLDTSRGVVTCPHCNGTKNCSCSRCQGN